VYSRSNIILHLRLGPPSEALPSGFPTRTLYAFLFSTMRATCPEMLFIVSASKQEASLNLKCNIEILHEWNPLTNEAVKW
jgi:hypothetical protein